MDKVKEKGKVLEKKEKNFLKEFPYNANLSDNYEDLINYGFFHFTKSTNLTMSRKGIVGAGIENKGLVADIGENSKEYENEERTYYAIGALGAVGIINRAIFLQMTNLIVNKGMNPEEAKKVSFELQRESLLNSIYLKMNIEDGIDYSSKDFMTRRNSHTMSGKDIPPEKLVLLSVNGSTNALDIFEFFYNNCDSSQIRLGQSTFKGYMEENYIDEFIGFVHEKNTLKNSAVQELDKSSLKMLDLEEKKREFDAKLSMNMSQFTINALKKEKSYEQINEADMKINNMEKNQDLESNQKGDEGVGE